MFADDQTVSKGMVKYACGITKESIVDVEGVVAVPAQPIDSATQKNVSCSGHILGLNAGVCHAQQMCLAHTWQRRSVWQLPPPFPPAAWGSQCV